MKQEEKITELFRLNERLRSCVDDRIMSVPYTATRRKHLYTAFALGKSYKTHKAVLILCHEHYGTDAAVLSRSLFELMVNMLYILNDTTDYRLERYILHDWVIKKKM